MSIFTCGCSFRYSFAAASRVESTHTVNGPSFCGTWAKPSLRVVLVPPAPQAVAAATTVVRQPANSTDLLLTNALPRRDGGFIAVISNSTTLWAPRAERGMHGRGDDRLHPLESRLLRKKLGASSELQSRGCAVTYRSPLARSA